MDKKEYEAVKDMTYLEYCDYLQKKYGIGRCDYMRETYTKRAEISRTKDGLLAHHKMEDRMIMLSHPEYAKKFPFEWQKAHNIVYCDYLEHLFLHILICEYPSKEKIEGYDVGIGGVVNFLVPELNDVYSGWMSKQQWRENCYNKIREDKDVYLLLVQRFIQKQGNGFEEKILESSYNDRYDLWDIKKNKKLFREYRKMAKGKKKLFKLF